MICWRSLWSSNSAPSNVNRQWMREINDRERRSWRIIINEYQNKRKLGWSSANHSKQQRKYISSMPTTPGSVQCTDGASFAPFIHDLLSAGKKCNLSFPSNLCNKKKDPPYVKMTNLTFRSSYYLIDQSCVREVSWRKPDVSLCKYGNKERPCMDVAWAVLQMIKGKCRE